MSTTHTHQPASLPAAAWPTTWSKPRPRPLWQTALIWLVVLAFAIAASQSLHIDMDRLAGRGMTRLWAFVQAFFPPNYSERWSLIQRGLLESLGMAVVATALGALLSIPVGFCAARCLTPKPIAWCARGIIVIARSLHDLVVAILVVAMLGYGPLAGVVTLTFATVGFFAKLLADAIEDQPAHARQAMAAQGAHWTQTWTWAIWPQVKPRILGLTAYRLDINFRESAIIGIVGAGGIGATLNTSIERGPSAYPTTAAILLLIIAIVLGMELLAGSLRRRLT